MSKEKEPLLAYVDNNLISFLQTFCEHEGMSIDQGTELILQWFFDEDDNIDIAASHHALAQQMSVHENRLINLARVTQEQFEIVDKLERQVAELERRGL